MVAVSETLSGEVVFDGLTSLLIRGTHLTWLSLYILGFGGSFLSKKKMILNSLDQISEIYEMLSVTIVCFKF